MNNKHQLIRSIYEKILEIMIQDNTINAQHSEDW